jgi:small GTP-binding protein
MPANLTPQYMEAEAEYKKAQTPADRLASLKKMYALLPKHKGTDKMQADLKAKISQARDEAESDQKTGKKAGVSYKIPKQGAGQYVILGAPNVGKSQLLNKLTRAAPQVAPYPFTTHAPQAGMMDWEDARVQLIDMPPITADFLEGFVSSMVRTADAALLLVDLGDDDCLSAVEAVLDRLAQVKTVLVGTPPEEVEDYSVEYIKTLLIGNKIDLPDADTRLELVRESFGARFPVHVISAEHGTGMEELRTVIFKSLNMIRVYTKQPGKPPDMTSPFTCPAGSTVEELAGLVHRDFIDKLKTARVWGTGVFDGQTVGREHELHDKDVVELHV